MAKQVSKTVIGAFVISSIAILIAGVIILGGGEIFKKTNKYVMFFEKSVKGLKVGAPVIWLGVEVGSVSSIVLDADPQKLSINVPVVIEIDPNRFRVKGEDVKDTYEQIEQLKRLIEKGLRAQLTLQSIVTGQLIIELGFFPDSPVRLTGLEPGYPEIPTVQSSMDQLTKKIEKLPIDKIAGKLLEITGKVDQALADANIAELGRNLNEAGKNLNLVLKDTGRLVNNVNGEVEVLSKDLRSAVRDAKTLLKGTSRNIQAISDDTRKLLKNADTQIQPLSNNIQSALVSARKAMDQAEKTLVHVDGFVGEKSDTRHKLNHALDEISTAARSLDSFLDYLERHPEALLKGKGGK